MDDNSIKALNSIVFSLVFLTGVAAQALDFEHISLEQKEKLEREFQGARSASDSPDAITGRNWTCDMYGIRSRLQVKRDVKLYSLKKDELGGFRNSGSQVISNYGSNFEGRNERFEDQLRVTPTGQLISRLSLRGEADPNSSVIAYSVCR